MQDIEIRIIAINPDVSISPVEKISPTRVTQSVFCILISRKTH